MRLRDLSDPIVPISYRSCIKTGVKCGSSRQGKTSQQLSEINLGQICAPVAKRGLTVDDIKFRRAIEEENTISDEEDEKATKVSAEFVQYMSIFDKVQYKRRLR